VTKGLRELQPVELAAELERAIVPVIAAELQSRADGHCMRVSDLDGDLMVRLCGRLREKVPSATVVILTDGTASVPGELSVTSTKLVELRNPNLDGTLRPPLLVFVPSGLRAAAEDSFGIATFEELAVGDVYARMRTELTRQVPTAIRGALQEGLNRLTANAPPWAFADDVALVRYLLTAKLNGSDPEAYGGALYELGLVPDFELFAEPAKAPGRITRNRDCVTQLTWSPKSERGRVLDLGLKNRAFRNKLGDFLSEAGVEDTRAWTRRIVLDRSLWELAFSRWEFEDGGAEPESICISSVMTDLPVMDEAKAGEKFDQLIAQRVLPLGTHGLKKFSVTFQVDPIPKKVQGLEKFVAQVISKNGGPIGLARAKRKWESTSQQATITFSKLSKIEWEEGWHFVRILAQTEDGDLIPITDEHGAPLPWASDDDPPIRRSNESDLFYVVPGDEVEVEPPQRAIPNDSSVTHAILRLQFSAVAGGRDPNAIHLGSVDWSQKSSAGGRKDSHQIEAKFPREGSVHVSIARPLKLLEQRILSIPDGPLHWRLPITLGIAGASTGEPTAWPTCVSTAPFLQARQRYFEAIRQDAKELITQATDLRATRLLVSEYAKQYLGLIRELGHKPSASNPHEAQQALAGLRAILALDTVAIVVKDHRDVVREATLVAPTHPLRALWLSVWAALGGEWLSRASKAEKDHIVPARDALLRQLAPVAYPPVLPTEAGHVLSAVESLNPFWTLYAPTFEDNPRGLLGDVCAAIGIPEPGVGGTAIDGEYLATRVRRYLLQHPYVQTLTINAFNAGRGSLLSDMLLALQGMEATEHLRYDITLFVPDPEAPGAGEALTGLFSPTSSLSAREAEAFATPSSSHLTPKLRLAVRATREFRNAPENHPAHLSFMFDVFPAENVSVAKATLQEACSPIHGLVQDFQVTYREDEAGVRWNRQPRHGSATTFDGAEELCDLLADLASAVSSATATVATGQTGLDLRPVVTLSLSTEDRALLHQLHEVSDWVLTLDRNLGIEYFDHGGRQNRPEYLIDHSPEGIGLAGHHLVVTSRSVAELEAMIRPVLKSYNLDAEGRHAVAILEQLRCLSGRLALKLISSSSQKAEALGLALSRMYLEHQGVFENQVVVPLDSHLELYRALKDHADELGNEVSFRRTDLALFDLNASERLITCRLVEVKCYSQVGDIASYTQLKSDIVEQVHQSEEVLGFHFDPHRSTVDRPDRLIKTRELVTLLEFYLDRALRYGIITCDAAEEARFLLRTLEDGYRLAFTRSAIVFDFQHTGTEDPEVDAGIEFHRIGIDLIRQLIEAAAPDSSSESGLPSGTQLPQPDGGPPSHGLVASRRKRERAPAVRSHDSAAFLGQDRDRSVSWADLRAKRMLGQEASEQSTGTVLTHPAVSREAGAFAKSGTPAGAAPIPDPKDELISVPDGHVPQLNGKDLAYDVMLGVAGHTPQYGLLGELAGRKVALDLNHTHTISLFGVQGGGKSYTVGSIVEMASMPIKGLNRLPQPLAAVVFHYSPTMEYRPEFTSMVRANTDSDAIAVLKNSYGGAPLGLDDVVLLVPADKIEARRAEYPGLEVYPLKFASSELQTSHWRFLMGAVGNQATYIRQLNRVIKSLRDNLTIDGMRSGIESANLPDHLKDLARMRLDLAAEYIDDNTQLRSLIRPSRLVIVDLRDEFIEKDEALGLFVVLLQLFADAKHNGESFNKLVVFDEAHKYVENEDLVAGLVEVVREMRHKGTSIVVASQDPPSVPVALIELSSHIILHKFNSPAWLKHIQKANAALSGLTPEKMAHLKPGEAFIWSSKATDEAFSKGAVKIRLRPRVTLHGGGTQTAVPDHG
jgi:DNA phosphorothioation-dependent restriction protein DptH